MLDAPTKRRIDSCRDILVGKVPDPKSQVEQITIALIYKFMDDMDAEAEYLGGKRSFFAGEYAQYGWAKLMAPTLGGYEMPALYSESLAKMSQNPGVPPLFRDIFKDASLPYRDPVTLRAFLKEINGFTYNHSEDLGDAFEYLLSVLGSQGDAGQFRTPRHIIDFIVDIVAPQKGEKILDPACGTAGFLISAYKHIQKANTQDKLGDLLTTEDRLQLTHNLVGYDISPDMVRLSLVNLYLHGFVQPHIEEYDTLTNDAKWNEQADVILANPPFMSPKGGIKPHKRFSVPSNRSEVLFVDYIAEHLSDKGRAGVIVPEGVIFQSGGAYKQLRELLVKKYLIAVISLPAGVFQPYSGVKTSILLMDRKLAKQADSVLFLKIENDGFGLGAQRRASGKDDIPAAKQHLNAWTESLRAGTAFNSEDAVNVHLVPKVKFAASSDYNLSGERYRVSSVASSDYPIVKLASVCHIARGGSPRPIQHYITADENGINWIKIGDAIPGSKYISSTKEKITLEGANRSRAVKKGDFILSNSMSFGRPYIMNTDGCIHDGWLLLSPDYSAVNKDYLYQIIGSDLVYKQFQRSATGGVVNNLNAELVRNIEIPLPPLAVQQEIVAEIEGYQKVIDGARQVVENYKPRIQIDPAWPMVALGEVARTGSGGTPSKSAPEYWQGDIPWVSPKDMKVDFIADTEDHISEAAVRDSATKMVDADTLLCVVRSGILQHSFPVAITTRKMCFNQDIVAITPTDTRLDIRYIFYMFKARSQKILETGIKPGVTVQSFHTGFFKNYKLPLPSLEIQQAIVAEIEAEQRLVEGNKELIRRFEGKIKAAIDRVWGEAAEAL